MKITVTKCPFLVLRKKEKFIVKQCLRKSVYALWAKKIERKSPRSLFLGLINTFTKTNFKQYSCDTGPLNLYLLTTLSFRAYRTFHIKAHGRVNIYLYIHISLQGAEATTYRFVTNPCTVCTHFRCSHGSSPQHDCPRNRLSAIGILML